uniref:3-phytase B n=1 Tax=Talaromyces marneffei PM1 TaxID=1077442 RepID=A0A093V6S0_TALMA
METQQPPTPVQIDNWHALGVIYGVEEESTTEAPADILHESPPSTIPFDEDSPPHQPSIESLPPSQDVGHTASSPSLVVTFRIDEEDDPAHRPDCAISAPPLRKRKREDLDG